MITAYQPRWDAFIAGGGVDNAANRGAFAVDRVFDYLQDIYRGESYKENIAALPTPEIIE